jgi:hypothetical protein
VEVEVLLRKATQQLQALEVQELSYSNMLMPLPFPTPVAASPIQPQLLVALALQHLPPVQAMSLGVNNGTLRIS